MRKRALRITVGLLRGAARFRSSHPSPTPKTHDPVVVLGQQVNLLWVVIGAVLVIFMQAGFALVETGFCRAKHAAHVVSHELRHLRPRVRRLLPRRLPADVRRLLDVPPLLRLRPRRAVGGALIGSGNWVFLWKGGWALSGGTASTAGVARPSSSTWSPSWTPRPRSRPAPMAERWKWKQLRDLGPLLRRHLLPAVRRRGPGAAAGWPSSATRSSSGFGYVDFAGSGVVHAVGGVAGAGRRASCSGPASASTARTASRGRCPATTSRWPCSARSSCCSAGSASTPPRRFAATDVQFAVVADEHGHRRRLRRHRRRCSGS